MHQFGLGVSGGTTEDESTGRGLMDSWLDSERVSLQTDNNVRREVYKYCILLVWNKLKLYLLSIMRTKAVVAWKALAPEPASVRLVLQVPDPVSVSPGLPETCCWAVAEATWESCC